MTTFQIVRKDEDGNEEVCLNEQSKSDRLPLSVVQFFKNFEGENVFMSSWNSDSKKLVVVGRGGVLNAAGKAFNK